MKINTLLFFNIKIESLEDIHLLILGFLYKNIAFNHSILKKSSRVYCCFMWDHLTLQNHSCTVVDTDITMFIDFLIREMVIVDIC